MTPKPFEIYWARKVWNGCEDERPWLVVEELRPGVFNCFAITTKDYRNSGFLIEAGHADSKSTNLKKDCFIYHDKFVQISIAEITRFKGILEPPLLNRFLTAAGLDDLIP
jgi:hypothetical protein